MDPEDPTVIAENELLGAAASIDAAAKKLASLRPRKSLQVRHLFLLPNNRQIINEIFATQMERTVVSTTL